MIKILRQNLQTSAFIVILLLAFCSDILAQDQKIFLTDYTDIFYSDESVLSDFFWRLTGKRLDFMQDKKLARSQVDRIIDRVQSVLDMHPLRLRVRIDLYAHYESGKIASYSHKAKSISVYADKVTDGVFAHEIAHAVISNHFSEPPSEKVQEILAQYVDRYLWSDY